MKIVAVGTILMAIFYGASALSGAIAVESKETIIHQYQERLAEAGA